MQQSSSTSKWKYEDDDNKLKKNFHSTYLFFLFIKDAASCPTFSYVRIRLIAILTKKTAKAKIQETKEK